MQKQDNVLRYGIELYFHESNLAIEFDENGYNNRNVDYETKKKKAAQQELGWEFIRIDPHKKAFDIFKAINKIFRHIKKSTNQICKKI